MIEDEGSFGDEAFKRQLSELHRKFNPHAKPLSYEKDILEFRLSKEECIELLNMLEDRAIKLRAANRAANKGRLKKHDLNGVRKHIAQLGREKHEIRQKLLRAATEMR